MSTLRDVIKQVRSQQTSQDDWLYIACDAKDLTLGSEAALGCPVFDEGADEEREPPELSGRGFHSTIDIAALEDSIAWADRLSGKADDAAAACIVRYYIRFDAWPDAINAPDPPSRDEILRRLDREFSDKLGAEQSTKPCRFEGCGRGVVPLSVFCRRHHFESVRKRPYPFDD
jgi:hypothetical protein